MKNYFTAIIVTYNPNMSILNLQYQSIKNQVDTIIYIDNGSKNLKEIELFWNEIINNSDKILVIRNGINKGLGFAQNQGINMARNLSTTHILLLDHDSVVQHNFVSNLYDTEKDLKIKGHKVGAIGAMYFNKSTGEIYPITKYFGPFIKRIRPSEIPVEASFLIASGCFISIKVLDQIGGMNEDLFVDYIDVEWCFRAKSFGYKVFVSPKAKMDHQIGDKRTSVFGRMISVHSPLRRYYLFRNSVFMLRQKDVYLGYKIREITFNLMRLIIFLLLSKDRSAYLKYSLNGFIDGINGKTGECKIK